MTEESPNSLVMCSLCNTEVVRCCMLSPDFSLKPQFEHAMKLMREHLKDEHEIIQPFDGHFQIYINAQKKEWKYETISYQQICELMFGSLEENLTLQFSRGPPENPQGTLTYKHFVKIQDGMVFDISRTGNA